MRDETVNKLTVEKQKPEKLTVAMCEELRHHKDRANITFSDLFKTIELPEKLTNSVVLGWFRYGEKRVNKNHFDLVLAQLKALPSSTCVSIDSGVQKKLKDYMEKTGVGPHALLSAGENPYGIHIKTIYWWMNGGIQKKQKVEKAHLDFVIQRWEEILISQKYKIPLSDEIREELRVQMERTGVDFYLLLKRAKDKPKGLNVKLISNWERGAAKTVRKDHFSYVLNEFQAIPDKNTPAHSEYLAGLLKQKKQTSEKLVPICGEKRERLLRYRNRTGISTSKLLRIGESVPDGLTAQLINGWIYRSKQAADPDYVDYVLGLWESLPVKSGRKQILAETIKLLQHHENRTGVKSVELMEGCYDIPSGLAAKTVEDWLSGTIDVTWPMHIDYILSLWEALPDCPFEMVDVDFAQLDGHRKRTGVEALELISSADGTPRGLNFLTVSNLLNGSVKVARENHLDFILERYEEMDAVVSPEPPVKKEISPVPLTDLMVQDLLNQLKRTDYEPSDLVKFFKKLPVKKAEINDWLSGVQNMVNINHYQAVIVAWRKLPSAQYRLVDKAYLLQYEIQLRDLDIQDDSPIGLDPSIIDGWLRGKIRTAKAYHWDYVVSKIDEAIE